MKSCKLSPWLAEEIMKTYWLFKRHVSRDLYDLLGHINQGLSWVHAEMLKMEIVTIRNEFLNSVQSCSSSWYINHDELILLEEEQT